MGVKGTADSGLTKAPYQKVEFNPEELDQFLKCCDKDTGPLYFMTNFMRIQHPTKGSMTFTPYDYQIELIRNYHHYRKSINLMSRQTGKSTCAAGYLLWFAMFNADKEILIASNKGKNAADIMRRIRYAYENCPDHIRAGVVEYNKGSISFDNGSRIVAETTTETTGRGMSISLAYLDEFAFVRPTFATEFWTSLSPTLSTGGKCIMTSTPNSDEDLFATIWKQANNIFDAYGNENPDGVGSNGFKPYLVTWEQHPDRDEQWAEEERRSIGEEKFRREHKCEFVIYSETLIDPLFLIDMEGHDPVFKTGQVRWYRKPNPKCTYAVGLDPSTGTGGDPAAIQVVELPSMVQIGEWQHNKTPIENQIKCLLQILQYLRECGVSDEQIYWSVESNAVGEGALVVVRDTGEENFPGEFVCEPKRIQGVKGRRGLHTTPKSKLEACLSLKRYVENGKLTCNSKILIKEFKSFIAHGNSFAASAGSHDDCVMAMLLVIRIINYIAQFEESVHEAINSNLHNDVFDDYDEPYPIEIL